MKCLFAGLAVLASLAFVSPAQADCGGRRPVRAAYQVVRNVVRAPVVAAARLVRAPLVVVRPGRYAPPRQQGCPCKPVAPKKSCCGE